MNDPAIDIKNLSKMFKVYNSPRDMFWEFLGRRRGYKEFWALDGVSFSIKRGEAVGIMGRNGAGKSTILRILAGTLDATAGDIAVNGRVSAILELGSGFNPEYTGRENIINGGLCLGMAMEEIRAKMDEIVDFSGLRDFINQPFKTYSSGMQARLTFATAIHVNPDILIVDEALSVGDAKFQRKCLTQIDKMKQEGVTILMVSHADNAITMFCDRAILLEEGKVVAEGPPKHITNLYFELLYGPESENAEQAAKPTGKEAAVEANEKIRPPKVILNLAEGCMRTGTREKAEIVKFGLADAGGGAVTRLESGQKYTARMNIYFHEDVYRYLFGINIYNVAGLLIFGSDTATGQIMPLSAKKGEVHAAAMDMTLNLSGGDYFMDFGVAESTPEIMVQDFLRAALHFHVYYEPSLHTPSIVNLQHRFSAKNIGREAQING